MRAALFSKTDERLHLLAPFLFLPLVVAEFFLPAPLSFGARVFVQNFIEVGLGSAGHNGLSWGLIFLTPEGRLWLRDRGGRKMLGQIGLVALLIFASASVLFTSTSGKGSLFIKLFLAADWILVLHHALSQTQGLSFIYTFNSMNPADTQQAQLARKIHSRQKIGFALLIALLTLPMLNYVFNLDVLTTTLQKSASALATAAVAGWIIWMNRAFTGSQRNKYFFLSRLIYLPLISFSFFAAMAFRVIHAVEYVFIYRGMLGRSRSRIFGSRVPLVIFSILFFASAIFLWTFSIDSSQGFLYVFPQSGELPLWLKLMAALSVTRLYMHYYLDRQIFRMRDPASRKWMGRLLKPKSAKATHAPNAVRWDDSLQTNSVLARELAP